MTTAKQAALDRLQEGVANLMSSAGWQAALTFRNQFHSYSFLNSLLILAQRPDATLVCGYRKWQQLGRQVRKGESGIRILAPLLRKDEHDPDKKVLIGFKEVRVFDIRQTDGDPIPTPPKPTILHGDNARIQTAITALEGACSQWGIRLDRNLDHPRALGVYRHADRSISLRAGLPKLQELKTLVHELAHALLHDPSSDRRLAELEAESAAYLTLDQLGLDTSAYSFAYLASWTDDLERLITAGDNASKAANQLLDQLQPVLASAPQPEADAKPLRRPLTTPPSFIAH